MHDASLAPSVALAPQSAEAVPGRNAAFSRQVGRIAQTAVCAIGGSLICRLHIIHAAAAALPAPAHSLAEP